MRMTPKGFVLLLLKDAQKVWSELWPVRCKKVVNGVQKLEKVDGPVEKGTAWEFIEVDSASR